MDGYVCCMPLGSHRARLHIQRKRHWKATTEGSVGATAQARKWIQHPEAACGETQRVGEGDIGR